jgi:hypothetical protein
MVVVREPILKPIAIADLRPTQMTVGMREVQEKRKRLRVHPTKKIGKFLGSHMIPVVEGPKGRLYVIDHHHLALALHKEGIRDVLVTIISHLDTLDTDAFWTVLDHRSWTHPYDVRGRRRTFGDIPKSLRELEDDPYRSLAGEIRRAGGFAKDTTPFSEFLWADFFRRRIKRSQIAEDFPVAAKRALKLAKSDEAHYLPGWCGPSDD